MSDIISPYMKVGICFWIPIILNLYWIFLEKDMLTLVVTISAPRNGYSILSCLLAGSRQHCTPKSQSPPRLVHGAS